MGRASPSPRRTLAGSAGAAVTRRSFVSGCAALAVGCATAGAPDLARLYRDAGDGGRALPPLIVIPGAFGSLLRDARTGRELWPGPGLRLLFDAYRDLAVPFDEDTLEPVLGAVEAPNVLPERLRQDFYGALLRTLERAGGYQRRAPGQTPAPRRSYYVLSYDWRLDNTLATRALHQLIERIRSDHRDASLPVDVLAHSNGGLLARYFARFGPEPLPADGPPRGDASHAPGIRRMLLVGTPNLGTLQPVLSCIRGEEMGLRHMPQEVVATCSGAPQLMPHPAQTWAVSSRGRALSRDVFDLETWRELRWCMFDPHVRERTIAEHGGGASGRRYLAALERYFARHLERGRRFMTSLAEPTPPGDVRPFVFGGDCAATLARVVVERAGERVVAHESPDELAEPRADVDYAALMFEPGDLVVTRSSLLGRTTAEAAPPPLAIEHAVFLCEEHRRLTANATFQNNLLHTLLADSP